jgi:hypothetical protein
MKITGRYSLNADKKLVLPDDAMREAHAVVIFFDNPVKIKSLFEALWTLEFGEMSTYTFAENSAKTLLRLLGIK